jgi:hypothetical protein
VRVLIANNTGREAKRLLAAFPERIGHIYGPGGWRAPWPLYALDNGAFPAWTKGRPFDADAFRRLIDSAIAAPHPPQWLAVPDVVADRAGTLESWAAWESELSQLGWPLAFVAQDGMTPGDVPAAAAVVFVGGTTAWKRSTAGTWCRAFPRVHVGRVNGKRDLVRYQQAGAESCDGTGWFRGDRQQLDGLWHWLADTSGHASDVLGGPMQGRLFAGT